MSGPQEIHTAREPRRRRVASVIAVTGLALAFVACLSALALAGTTGSTVGSASNAKLGERVAVDAHGRTLYALSPETSHHLLCKNSECLKFWPPLTVRSSKTKLEAGPGVHGRLAILRRPGGMLQVTLGGLPLYRYAGDSAPGDANGQHIHSFGGTWHVIVEASQSGQSAPAPPTPAPTPSPTPSPSPTPTPSPAPSPTPYPAPSPAPSYPGYPSY